MRLQILEDGHHPIQRMILSVIRVVSGERAPGPILVLSYRRELFGKHFAACLQEGMRGAKEWSVGEVELFATFVSHLNECKYCIGDHTAVTALGMGDHQLIAAVLQDWRIAPINERIRSALGFLEKVTLTPANVTADDLATLQAAGVNEQAIEEILYVCFLFSVLNRLADAFDFHLPTIEGFQRNGRIPYTLGYGMGSIPG